MDADAPWAAYARVRALADSDYLSNQARAADKALETILDMIEDGQAISPQQVDNLLRNRARTQRQQCKLLGRHAHLLCGVAANESDRLEARSELARHQGRCSRQEWRLLVTIGLGYTYGNIAKAYDVPEATIKTWVRRARLKLAA
jgi:DNA-binding NarL/FixJ family response regulator